MKKVPISTAYLAAVLLSGSVGMAVGQCTSLIAAVTDNGLNSLAAAVATVLSSDVASRMAPLAGSAVELAADDKFTLFAPSDAAFKALSELPPADILAELLLSHVADAYLPSEVALELLTGQTLDGPGAEVANLPGDILTVRQDGLSPPGIYVTAEGQVLPGAKVVTADIETCAGVIHIIDKILLAAPEAMVPSSPRCRPGLLGSAPTAEPLEAVAPVAGTVGPAAGPVVGVDAASPIAGGPATGNVPVGDAVSPSADAAAPSPIAGEVDSGPIAGPGDVPGEALEPASTGAVGGSPTAADSASSREAAAVVGTETSGAPCFWVTGTAFWGVAAAAFAILGA